MPDPIHTIQSPTLVLPTANIDTDQIIPARFLVTTQRQGLGVHLFADWRQDTEVAQRLDDERTRACKILVAGPNFGCGSSREHAPWALLDAGFRAVVSTSIADIFCANAIKNGLLPVTVDRAPHTWLLAHPWAEVVIDLDHQTLTLSSDQSSVGFAIDAFAKHCLTHGMDQLDYLLGHHQQITRYENNQR